MSDSIYIKNSVFNDSDALTTSTSLAVRGVPPTAPMINMAYPFSINILSGNHSDLVSLSVVSSAVFNVVREPSKCNLESHLIYTNKNAIRLHVIESLNGPLKRTLEFPVVTTDVINEINISRLMTGVVKLRVKGIVKQDEKYDMYPMTEVLVKYPKTNQFNMDLISKQVFEGKKSVESGYVEMPMATVDVNNDYPTAEGPLGGASGGDLERMVFTVQQSSFFEFRFYFKLNKVTEVTNLPQGMHFDKIKQRMYGTPALSGRYPINIIQEDQSNILGIIEVPKLYREL